VADYLLTLRALKDLDAIADYSLERWGRDKTHEYLTALTDRMQWLADDPGRGHPRDGIDAGYRCFGEGQHLILIEFRYQHFDHWRATRIDGH